MRALIELMAFPEDLMAPFNLIFNPSMVTQGLKNLWFPRSNNSKIRHCLWCSKTKVTAMQLWKHTKTTYLSCRTQNDFPLENCCQTVTNISLHFGNFQMAFYVILHLVLGFFCRNTIWFLLPTQLFIYSDINYWKQPCTLVTNGLKDPVAIPWDNNLYNIFMEECPLSRVFKCLCMTLIEEKTQSYMLAPEQCQSMST